MQGNEERMNDTLKRCLEDLEARIDPQLEGPLWQEWSDFSTDRFQGDLFSPRRSKAAPPAVELANAAPPAEKNAPTKPR